MSIGTNTEIASNNASSSCCIRDCIISHIVNKRCLISKCKELFRVYMNENETKTVINGHLALGVSVEWWLDQMASWGTLQPQPFCASVCNPMGLFSYLKQDEISSHNFSSQWQVCIFVMHELFMFKSKRNKNTFFWNLILFIWEIYLFLP